MKKKYGFIPGITSLAVFVLLIAAFALSGHWLFQTEQEPIIGQMVASDYLVASKLSARIERNCVEEGDYVHVGDTLAILTDPELDDQQMAAEATERAATAMSNLTNNGSREEQVRKAGNGVRMAQATLDIASKTYRRYQKLADEGVISTQKLDEARSAYEMALAQRNIAQKQWEILQSGARKEEKAAAAANTRAAAHGVEVVRSLLRESVQRATVEGEVEKIFAHKGELVTKGTPMMSMTLRNDQCASFLIHKDQLHDIHIGQLIRVYSPSLNRYFPMRVFFVRIKGEMNDRQTTSATDPVTFEVRARPLSTSSPLRPGMSVEIRPSKSRQN